MASCFATVVLPVLLSMTAILYYNAVELSSLQENVAAVVWDPPEKFTEDVAHRLAESLKFKTVSGIDYKNHLRDEGEMLKLHDFLLRCYPFVHKELTKETVSDFSLLYTWHGSDRSLKPMLLMSHLDVVPADEDTGEWTYGPFEGKIAEGFIWGRGALDVKSGVIFILEAVETLLKEGFKPKRSVYLAFGHDEESGSSGANQIAATLKNAGVLLEFVLDEGGFVSSEGISGLIKDPVALVGVAEKGYIDVELTANITGGHSSVPSLKGTSITALSKAIDNIHRKLPSTTLSGATKAMFRHIAPECPNLFKRMVLANLWMFGPLMKLTMGMTSEGSAMLRSTYTPTIIHGGVKRNVIPKIATAVVNIRIMPGESVKSVLEHLSEVVADSRITIAPIAVPIEPSAVSPSNGTSWQWISTSIHETLSPVPIVAPYLVVGLTDSRQYASLTGHIYRFGPIFLNLKSDLHRIHGIDERIATKAIPPAVHFYRRLIELAN